MTTMNWRIARVAALPVGLAWALGACAAAKYTTTTDRHVFPTVAGSDDATKRDHGVAITVAPIGVAWNGGTSNRVLLSPQVLLAGRTPVRRLDSEVLFAEARP